MLVLVGLRLGLDGVNPIYYESVKVRLPCSIVPFPALLHTSINRVLYTSILHVSLYIARRF